MGKGVTHIAWQIPPHPGFWIFSTSGSGNSGGFEFNKFLALLQ